MEAPKPLKIIWGFPCGASVGSRWLRNAIDFMRKTDRHFIAGPFPADHAGRLDLARSYLVDIGKVNSDYDWMITYDTSTAFYTQEKDRKEQLGIKFMTLDFLMELLEDCRQKGYDGIGAAGTTEQGLLLVQASIEQWSKANSIEPFEVDGFAGTIMAFTRRALDAIEPRSSMTDLGGNQVKLYCHQEKHGTEDFNLCARFRDTGLRLCVDPRITLGKWREHEQYYDPRDFDRIGNQYREALLKLQANPQIEAEEKLEWAKAHP